MTIVDLLLAVATVAVVPATLALHPATAGRGGRLSAVVVALGTVAAVGLALERGPTAAVLAAPWLLTTLVLLVLAARHWVAAPSWRGVPWVAAAGYLVVGATWLLVDRADGTLLGFTQPLVQLTAAHFHYAGFGATLLAACALAARPDDRLAVAAAVLVVGAPPFVALGFLAVDPLLVVGAVLLTAGLYASAWVVGRRVAPVAPRRARWLLVASSLSVVVPMVLAVQWALGAVLGTPALSIPTMARTHGALNALGFVGLGVLGWRGLATVTSDVARAGGDKR